MSAPPDTLSVTRPADEVAGPAQGHWSYDEYAAIPDDGRRYHVIDGVLYVTPAPNMAHQNAVTQLTTFLATHVRQEGLGKVFVAPTDVELADGRTVVQPDVLVILKEHADVLSPTRVIGAPDLVVEVSSPSTASHDRRTKMDAYAAAGIPEYWIADPYAQTVELLRLETGQYTSAGVFAGSVAVPSRILPGLQVAVAEYFA
jgi:Uma2 family endonuclease